MISWFDRLQRHFDPRVLAFFVSVYLGLKGGGGGLLRMALLPLFKVNAGVNSEMFQAYTILVMAPWALKPIFGLSDRFPMCGSSRGSYIAVASIIGTSAVLVFALNAEKASTIPTQLALLAMLANAQIALTDLLAEGKYAQLMRDTPESGSTLVSFVWGLAFVAQLLVAGVAGPVADDGNARLLLYAAVPLMAQASVPALSGWTLETPGTSGAGPKPWMYTMVVVMVLSTVAVTLAAMLGSSTAKCAVAACIILVVIGSSWTVMPSAIRKPAIYSFVAMVAQLQFTGPLDYFYTADHSCVENGPQFTMTFYLTTASIAAAFCGAFGVGFFEAVMGSWTFRNLFRFTTVLMCMVASVDVAIVTRTNLAIGISDRTAYLGGNACFGSVIIMMHTIPMAVLTSKMCPSGAESLVYAIVAGMQNLGFSISGLAGSGVAETFNVTFSKTNCSYSHLSTLLIVSTMVMPLLITFPLTFILIPPKIGLKDKLDT